MSKNIAIIGTRGAGKTVFVTVLARHLLTPKKGVLLIPESLDVYEYVDLNYARLQRGEWIPSTNTEQKLSFELRVSGKEKMQLTVLDFQGEVFQELFARKNFKGGEIGAKDQELVNYLLGSSTILLLINLQDFLDNSYEDDNRRLKGAREFSLIEFLAALKKEKSKNIGVAFTAYNQYRNRIKSEYTDVVNFVKAEMPTLYFKHFQQSSSYIPAFLISAVADTVEDKKGRILPKPGFKHEGLERVIEWIVDPVQYEKDSKIRESQKLEKKSQLKKQEEQKDVDGPKWTEW